MKFFKQAIYFLLVISLLNPSSFAFYSSRKVSSVDDSIRIDNQKMQLKIDEKQKQKIIDAFSNKEPIFKNYFDSLSKRLQKRKQRQMQVQQVKHFTGQASHLAAFIIALTVVGSVQYQINLARQSGKDFSWEWLKSAVAEGSIHALDNGHIFAGLVGAGAVGKTIQVGSAQGKKIADKLRRHRKKFESGKTQSSYNKIAKRQFASLISVTAMTIITFLGWEIASEFFAQAARKTQIKHKESIEKKVYTDFLIKHLNVSKLNTYLKPPEYQDFHEIIHSYLKLTYKDILKKYYNLDIEKIKVNREFLEKLNFTFIEELVRLHYHITGLGFNKNAVTLEMVKKSKTLPKELKEEYIEMDKDPLLYEKIISNIGTDRNAKVSAQMLETFFDDDSSILYDSFRRRIFTGEFVTFTLGLSTGAFASTFIPGPGLISSIGRFATTIAFVSLFVFGVPKKYQDSMTSWIRKKRVDLSISKIVVEQKKILQDYKHWIAKNRDLDSVKKSIKRRFKKLKKLREHSVHVAAEMIPNALIAIFQKYSSIALINQTLDETYIPRINAFSVHHHIHAADMNAVKIALKERQKFSCTEDSKIQNYNQCSSDQKENEEVKIFFSDLNESSKEKLRQERDEIAKELKNLEQNFYSVQYQILRIYADQWRFFDYINRQINYFDSINYPDQERINNRKLELSELFKEEEKSLLDLYRTHAFITNAIIQTDPNSCIHKIISADKHIHTISIDNKSNKVVINKDNNKIQLYSKYISDYYRNTGKTIANELSYEEIKKQLTLIQGIFAGYIHATYGMISHLIEYTYFLYGDYWGGSVGSSRSYKEEEELKFNSINNESLLVKDLLDISDDYRTSVQNKLFTLGKKNTCILSARSTPLKMKKLNEKENFGKCKSIRAKYEEYVFECVN